MIKHQQKGSGRVAPRRFRGSGGRIREEEEALHYQLTTGPEVVSPALANGADRENALGERTEKGAGSRERKATRLESPIIRHPAMRGQRVRESSGSFGARHG